MPTTGALVLCLLIGVWAERNCCADEDNRRERVLPRTPSAPAIDGRLDDEAWKDATKVTDWHVINSETQEAYHGPRVWVTHDDAWLYVAYKVPHPHPETIRPYCTRHDERVQGENCVKLSFAGGPKGRGYFIFRVSAGNVRSEQQGYDLGWDIPWRSATRITEHGWNAEMALPLCRLTTAKTLSVARMNFIVCLLFPEPGLDDTAYEEFGPDAFHRTVIAWGPTRGMSSYLPQDLFHMDDVLMKKTFLPYLESAELHGYRAQDGKASYAIAAQLSERGGAQGMVTLVAVDQQSGAEKSREIAKPVRLGKSESARIELSVPITHAGRRNVQVVLRDTATGETLQTYRGIPPDQTELLSAYVERTYYTTESNAVAVCRIRLSDEDLEGTKLVVFSEKGRSIAVGERLSSQTDLRIPIRDLQWGANSLRIVLQNQAGDPLAEEHAEVVRRKPNPGREIKVDRRARVIRKDGKPFFPFGFYLMGNRKDDLIEIAEGGMNTVWKLNWIPPLKQLEQLLDDLEETGLHLITPLVIESLSPTGRDILCDIKGELFYQKGNGLNYVERSRVFEEAFDKEIPWILKALERVKNHPAVLAWYTIDEPVSKKIFGMYRQGRELYSNIYALDGYRPVYQMGMTSVKTGPEDTDWADILGHDPYWVPMHPLAAKINWTANLTRRVREVADEERKPTWMVLTSECWSGTYKRFLNPVEIRCQAYLAIISGARGLLHYYYPVRYHGNWKMFCQLASEIETLSPAILTDDVPQSVRHIRNGKGVEDSDVLTKLFPDPDGQGLVLLAASQARHPIDTTFRFEHSGDPIRVTEMFGKEENHAQSNNENGFSERFEPLGVRVYKLSGNFAHPLKMDVELTPHPEDGDKEPEAYLIPKGKPEKNRLPNASFEDATNAGFPDYYVTPWFRNGKTERVGLPGCPFFLDSDTPWHGQQSLRLQNGDQHAYPLRFLLEETNPCAFSLYMRADRVDVRVVLTVNGKGVGKPASLTTKWKRYAFSLPNGTGLGHGSVELLPEKGSTVWFDALQMEIGSEVTPFEL